MYEKHRTFRTDGPKSRQVKRVLDHLTKVFSQKMPELSKLNALSLYIVVSELSAKYGITFRLKKIGSWSVDFELRRAEDEAKDNDQGDPDLVSYQLYLNQNTASQVAFEHRQRVLITDVLLAVPDLPLLDDQRQFTYDQHAAIF